MENVASTSANSNSNVASFHLSEVVQLTKAVQCEGAASEEILLVDINAIEDVLGNSEYKDHYVAIYTIAGPTRSGKSFLLSLLWRFLQLNNEEKITYDQWKCVVEKV